MPARKPGAGRPRKYCSDRCRRAAGHARRAPVGWRTIGSLPSLPADPLTLQRRSLEALAQIAVGVPAGPPEDQLAEVLTALPSIVFRLRSIAPELTRSLGVRAATLAEDVDRALHRSFAEVLP